MQGLANRQVEGVGGYGITVGAVAAAIGAGGAAGCGCNVVNAARYDEGDLLAMAFGALELGATLLNIGRDYVARSVWLLLHDEHGHVDHG